jgi:prepilin-type N-terminal cleavage/methylation domain-containing protein
MIKKQAGFTLLEFMVATLISLIVMGVGVAMYRDSTLANSSVTQTSDMNTDMRAGMNLIVQDLLQTGTGIPAGGIPIPNTTNAGGCNTGMPVNRPPASLNLKFQGPNASNSGCNVILPAIEPGAGLGPAVTSPDGTLAKASDVISILYADNTLALNQKEINGPGCLNGAIAVDGSTATFDSGCVDIGSAGIPVNPGDLIMFSNVNGNCIQTVTSVNAQTLNFGPGDSFNLNGRTTTEAAGTILQLQNVTNGQPNGTYPPTSATRLWMITYFLDDTTDPVHPRLMREVNFNTAQPVAESIEYVQFLYNFADGTATPPVQQPTVPNNDNENETRVVNVQLDARSAEISASTMKYVRASLTTQVALRSMAYFDTYE